MIFTIHFGVFPPIFGNTLMEVLLRDIRWGFSHYQIGCDLTWWIHQLIGESIVELSATGRFKSRHAHHLVLANIFNICLAEAHDMQHIYSRNSAPTNNNQEVKPWNSIDLERGINLWDTQPTENIRHGKLTWNFQALENAHRRPGTWKKHTHLFKGRFQRHFCVMNDVFRLGFWKLWLTAVSFGSSEFAGCFGALRFSKQPQQQW